MRWGIIPASVTRYNGVILPRALFRVILNPCTLPPRHPETVSITKFERHFSKDPEERSPNFNPRDSYFAPMALVPRLEQ